MKKLSWPLSNPSKSMSISLGRGRVGVARRRRTGGGGGRGVGRPGRPPADGRRTEARGQGWTWLRGCGTVAADRGGRWPDGIRVMSFGGKLYICEMLDWAFRQDLMGLLYWLGLLYRADYCRCGYTGRRVRVG